MAVFNPDQAIDFGVIMGVLGPNFSPSYSGLPGPLGMPPVKLGPVAGYHYSYGTVVNPIVNGKPTAQTADNVKAALNLFNDTNSVSPGFTMSFYGTRGQGSGTISTNVWDTSSMVLDAKPMGPNAYNTDLSYSTLISNANVVASSSLTFIFIPGTTQSQALQYSTGTTISEAVTNGITDTTTNSESISTGLSVTVGTKVTGGVPGATEEVSESVTASINSAWTQTTSLSTNYSKTTTNQTNTTVTTTTTVNLTSATPNADGTYSYGPYTLIPGNLYTVQIQLEQASYSSPITQTFEIYGPSPSSQMKFEGTTNGYPINNIFVNEVNIDYNPMQAISEANSWGYSTLSEIDPSVFQYKTGATDMVLYTGLVTATSVGSENATIVIRPVATPKNATNTGLTQSSMLWSDFAITAPQAAHTKSILDLRHAATSFSSKNGVYFNTSMPDVESTLVTQFLAGNPSKSLTLNGGYRDSAVLGNLNYDLTGFSHSNVTLGNGENILRINPNDNNNLFKLGTGNNTIFLDGKGNNIYLGEGENYIEVTGGSGKNFIIDNNGPTALKINSATGFTQVSKWNQKQDSLHFGSEVNLSDVKVTFNYNDWSYNVYVKEKLVANLITVGGLSLSDPTTKVTHNSAYAPSSMAIENTAGFLTGLYASAFHRAPDSSGFEYWMKILQNGASRAQIAESIFTSSEYRSHFKTSADYVDALYRDLLGRNPDAYASAHVKAIDTGTSQATIINAILNSNEYVQLVGLIT